MHPDLLKRLLGFVAPVLLPPATKPFASSRIGELKRYRDFDKLIRIVDKETGSISGIGDLAVYDFALRIGTRLRRLPERVYLHAGTREGAKALGLNLNGRASIEMCELPRALHVLKPWEAEDVLCIFKDDFAKLWPREAKKVSQSTRVGLPDQSSTTHSRTRASRARCGPPQVGIVGALVRCS